MTNPRWIALLICMLIAIPVHAQSPTSTLSVPPNSVPPDAASLGRSLVVFRNVMVRMRDSVQLATDIYLPTDDGLKPRQGRYPVILARTPYDKSGAPGSVPSWVVNSIEHGYAAVIQDVRGTHASQGRFDPMMDEGWGEHQDGIDLISWLRQQPWADGKVATAGGSYLGGTQMMLALLHPEGYVTGFIQVPGVNQFTDSWVYENGIFDVGTALDWSMMMSKDTAEHMSVSEAQPILRDYASIPTPEWDGKVALAELKGNSLQNVKVLRHLPFWQNWLKHREDPWYFRNNNIHDRLQDVATPLFLWGGWYDLFLRNVYQSYEGITKHAVDPAVRANTRMLIGPWGHSPCAECEKFPNSTIDDSAYQAAWMDKWFKGTSNPILDYPVVLYVMGENRWRAEQAWPVQGTVLTPYYLRGHPNNDASVTGGGLSVSAPAAEPPRRYIYDPRHTRDSLLGRSMIGGRAKQNSSETGEDFLVYTTAPLAEDTEVTGKIKATLYAASSATDTDWHVKLLDVFPDGTAFNLADGIIRARYRHARTEPAALVPNAIESYAIDLWATSNVFKKGHKIRVEISSSDYPNREKNPNAFIDSSRSTERDYVVAHQTIYHDAQHPSRIELPIIPNSRARHWIDTPFPLHKGDGYPNETNIAISGLRELPYAELSK